VTAGLFLVTALYVRLAANRFSIRNLRRFQDDFGVIPLLQTRHRHFNMLLPVPAIRNSFVCGSRKNRSIASSSISLCSPLLNLSSSARLFGSTANVIAGSGSWMCG